MNQTGISRGVGEKGSNPKNLRGMGHGYSLEQHNTCSTPPHSLIVNQEVHLTDDYFCYCSAFFLYAI